MTWVSSASVNFCPNFSMISFTSALDVDPEPSSSNTAKASTSSCLSPRSPAVDCIMIVNSSKSISPFLSASTSLKTSRSSLSVSVWPIFFITSLSSSRDIVPPPSLSNISNVSFRSAFSSSVSFRATWPFFTFPNDFIFCVATTPFTAALNFLLALKVFIASRFFPRSLPSREASLPVIHEFCRASFADRRFLGSTVMRAEMRSFAPFETCPQYSTWNSNCPLRILRKRSRWFSSMKGG
mmetsp:Transcript_29921/g.88967  ORF Transcript_29921/g.88967 Transcript_29921/m.88967 type:complete len:239 (+) Transcript_29921:755-1471(+)